MVPTTTGAAKAVGLVLPELAGHAVTKSYAAHVPVPRRLGSVDLIGSRPSAERTVDEVDADGAQTRRPWARAAPG